MIGLSIFTFVDVCKKFERVPNQQHSKGNIIVIGFSSSSRFSDYVRDDFGAALKSERCNPLVRTYDNIRAEILSYYSKI